MCLEEVALYVVVQRDMSFTLSSYLHDINSCAFWLYKSRSQNEWHSSSKSCQNPQQIGYHLEFCGLTTQQLVKYNNWSSLLINKKLWNYHKLPIDLKDYCSDENDWIQAPFWSEISTFLWWVVKDVNLYI